MVNQKSAIIIGVIVLIALGLGAYFTLGTSSADDTIRVGYLPSTGHGLPFQYTAEDQGLFIVKYSDEYLPNHPCCRIVSTGAKIDENRDKWVKFERALIKAYNYYKTNPDGSVAAVGKYVKMEPATLKEALYDGHLSLSPDPNKKGTLKYWELLEILGYDKINNKSTLEQSIDTTIYKDALDQLVKEDPDNANYQLLLKQYPELNG